jgi:LacI family transcriptional regulator
MANAGEAVVSASIQDVAKEANVSITTVSRVLNRNRSVREETRQRVESAIRHLNYRPNVFARGLMLKRSNTVAAFLPDRDGDVYARFIRGASGCARDLQQQLLVSVAEGEDDLCQQIEDVTLRGWIDGIVVFLPKSSLRVWQILERTDMATVVVGPDIGSRNFDNVRMDHGGAMSALVSHLVTTAGVHRPLFVGAGAQSEDSAERFHAFREAVAAHGIAEFDSLDVDQTGVEPVRASMVERFRSANLQFDAVVAADDDLAWGAIEAVRETGRRVPEDVRVVGFGDFRIAQWARPPLTTARAPIREMGARAVELLVRRVREPESARESAIVPARIVVRQSCGCTAH